MDQELLKRAFAAANATGQWLEKQNYAGNDPYQLDNIISSVGDRPLIGPLMGFARRVLKPYHALIPKQIFQASKPILMAQALGDALSGEGARAPDDEARRRAARMFQLLDEIRSPLAKNTAWGLPFVWGGVEKHPRHWPTTITTTIVLQGMMDAILLLNREAVAQRVESGIRFMIEECGVAELPEGDCILYGPGDTRLILNASAAAAGLMARAGAMFGKPDLIALAGRAASLVCHHRNDDGSWYFAPAHGAHPLDPIIDNRHTGYILEGLSEVREFGESGEITAAVGQAIDRGASYLRSHLLDEEIPRWSPDATYPVDAHDVAQGIQTSLVIGDVNLASRQVRFALDRFYLGDGMFRYKLNADGRTNDAVFIRWTQAPMYKSFRKFLALTKGD